MNKHTISNLSKNNVVKISKALFVLSQLATKRKAEIAALKEQISLNSTNEDCLKFLQQQYEHLSKKQRYFHSDRTEVMRYLISSGLAEVKGYITDSGYNFGLVKVGKYELYLILNKKIIQSLNLIQIGNELGKFEPLPDDVRDHVMTEKEAEKVFKLYLAKIRLKASKRNSSKKKENGSKDVVMSKTVSAKGNIVVVKKRRFSDLVASNKSSK